MGGWVVDLMRVYPPIHLIPTFHTIHTHTQTNTPTHTQNHTHTTRHRFAVYNLCETHLPEPTDMRARLARNALMGFAGASIHVYVCVNFLVNLPVRGLVFGGLPLPVH